MTQITHAELKQNFDYYFPATFSGNIEILHDGQTIAVLSESLETVATPKQTWMEKLLELSNGLESTDTDLDRKTFKMERLAAKHGLTY